MSAILCTLVGAAATAVVMLALHWIGYGVLKLFGEEPEECDAPNWIVGVGALAVPFAVIAILIVLYVALHGIGCWIVEVLR